MPVGQQSIGELPTTIVGRHQFASVRVVNLGHVHVWISEASDLTTDDGSPLGPGDERTFACAGGLYGVRDEGAAGGVPPHCVVAWSTER